MKSALLGMSMVGVQGYLLAQAVRLGPHEADGAAAGRGDFQQQVEFDLAADEATDSGRLYPMGTVEVDSVVVPCQTCCIDGRSDIGRRE